MLSNKSTASLAGITKRKRRVVNPARTCAICGMKTGNGTGEPETVEREAYFAVWHILLVLIKNVKINAQ